MILVVVLFLLFLVIKMPLAYAVGSASLLYYMLSPNLNASIAVQRMVAQTQSFTMLAIPFFIVCGNLMNATGITKRLVKFSQVCVGHLFGGLACISCLLSAVMGGISGSAVADATMEARILGPAMIKRGYSKGYSAAVVALSSTITATIPPSVGLIIFGTCAGVSIGRLFVGGLLPGIFMTLALMVPSVRVAKKRNYPRENEKAPTAKEVLSSLKECFWAMLFPVLLIVGIRFGVFTASEAGAFACVYALFVGTVIYKELTWKKLIRVLRSSIKDCAVVLYLTAIAALFGYASTYDGLPQALAKVMVGITENKYLMLILIVIFLFFMGMFMESTVNTLLFTPIMMPIITQMGIDPVHFGLIFELVIIIGAMTPPVGTAMFSVCDILKCSVQEYVKESAPFFAAIGLVILSMIFLPQVYLFLPNLIFG